MNENQESHLSPVEIPLDAVSAEALEAIIDSYIQREGTDYGANEAGHASKVTQIRRQLEKGDVKIAFDPNTESVSLVTKFEWAKAFKKN